MKNSNLKNARKLSRESQKHISGGDKQLVCQSGCVKYYFSDGQGNCKAPPCNDLTGSEVVIDGRTQCCF